MEGTNMRLAAVAAVAIVVCLLFSYVYIAYDGDDDGSRAIGELLGSSITSVPESA